MKQLVAAIRSAIEGSRIELYLQPIVTLPQRKVRYYEALSRLKADNGDLISKVVKVIPNVQERLGFSKAAFDKFVPPGRDNPPCKKSYD